MVNQDWIMCCIPGTWHNSLTVIFTVKEFCQHRKKIFPVTVEQPCLPPLLNNRASDCWTVVPATNEKSCLWLLINRTSVCWIIVPVTVEQLCQWLLNNRTSDCWTVVPATNEESYQWLLTNCARTVEQSCLWLLNNCASDSWIIVSTTPEESYHWLLLSWHTVKLYWKILLK